MCMMRICRGCGRGLLFAHYWSRKKNGYNEVRDIFEKRSKNLGKIILSMLVEKRGKTLALALILNFDDVTQMLWVPEGSISVSRCLLVFGVSFCGIGVWH